MNRPTTIHRRRALFDEAVAIIENEYAQDLDLDRLARRVATSRRQLQRVFNEIGGTSFRTHLARVRMRKAAEMLQSETTPVRDVAQSVGYRQPAQFAKAFRRHHGTPPSRFRGNAGAEMAA
ncbi:MAG: helix-turn-helix transcriptional regulator [Thermoleophilaceae bacterium]|nr:helix-turn-helix transcriptional regulator [Thermoleophilaceae bacterium]